MTIKPMRGCVLIRVPKVEDKQIGSLYVPTIVQEDAVTTGLVTAVGKGMLLSNGEEVTPDLKVGDTVLFNRHNSRFHNKTDYLVREDDIIGVVENENQN